MALIAVCPVSCRSNASVCSPLGISQRNWVREALLAADRFASSNVETAWWSFFFGRVRRFTDEQTRARPSWQSVIYAQNGGARLEEEPGDDVARRS